MPSQNSLLEVIKLQTDIAKVGLDLGDVMELVVERALPLTGADGALIELVDGDWMIYRAASGLTKSRLGLKLKRENSLSGMCVETGAILRCDDTEQDPRVNQDSCRQVGTRSMIVVPLKYKEVTVGVLKAVSQQPGKFTTAHMTLLGLLSELVGATIFFATKYGRDDLFFKATHDSLTGLANRSLFIDRLRSAIALGSRDARPVGVLMIDMDDLKKINDTYGHRVGDAVIKEFANRSRAGARASDTVARLGGDEFGVLLKPIDVPEGLDAAIQRQYEMIDAPFLFEHRIYHLHASIGAACFPDDGYDVGGLLDAADRRMYEIKREHKCGTALTHAS
ncbi:MAG: sensor domain-containing diguanylate cyclase [Oceanospirillales bacterium]|nr:sensor domain-containing diguanylate cyclase [Oceanospirillales bacterium]